MKLAQIILSNMPNKANPLSWIPFILVLIIMIPVLIIMIVLIPVLLIINLIKLKFFPNKNPKTFITPFGFAAYSQVERTVLNYPWHDIEKVEVWSVDEKIIPVLVMNSGDVVKINDISVEQVKAMCDQHQVTFYEEVVIVQDAV